MSMAGTSSWAILCFIVAIFLGGCGDEGGSTTKPPEFLKPKGKTQIAWDNHFSAFGAGVAASTEGASLKDALDKIMLDYTADSIVRIWNDATVQTAPAEYKGVVEIRAMFDGLFGELKGCNNATTGGLKAPVVEVDEGVEGKYNYVYLVWQCQSAKYNFATDTFWFKGNKILGQNIVVSKPTDDSRRLYAPANQVEAWENHFSAFGEKNLTKIMLDYDEKSKVIMWEWSTADTGSLTTYDTPEKIKGLFNSLFTQIVNTSKINAPLVGNYPDEKQVFLVWNAPEYGFLKATDSFSFTDTFKIRTQTITVVKAEER